MRPCQPPPAERHCCSDISSKAAFGGKSLSCTVTCVVCPRHCALAEGELGFCRGRLAQKGRVVGAGYGKLSALALDPVEKKPFYHFHPGKMILSAGGYGCNMRCPFCQNHEISQTGPDAPALELSPAELAQKALELVPRGNIGLAFTYNEPAVNWEYLRDAATAAKALGLQTAMVTNGYFCPEVTAGLLGCIDAFNIDLKCFTQAGYQSLGGGLATVQATIAAAVQSGAHVEVTTLVVPGLSDDEGDMERQAAWLAGLSPELPLHLSRYFPRWQASQAATPLPALQRLAAVARGHLRHVHLGNC